MNTTRDIAVVILVSVLGFVYAATIGQLPFLLTGIPGSNYILYFYYDALVSVAMLMYEGRRWRATLQGLLVGILFLPTASTGQAFDILSRIPTILNAFSRDILFNSVYGYFERKKKLLFWAVLATLTSRLVHTLLLVVTTSFYYTAEAYAFFVDLTLVMLPLIVIESIFGSLLGYKIYQRVKDVRV